MKKTFLSSPFIFILPVSLFLSVFGFTTEGLTRGIIIIHPGNDIQKAVDSNPEGATFMIKAGIHRFQSVEPKNGNTFVGEPGAIMSGAKDISKLFVKKASYWVATGQTQQGQVHGLCTKNEDGTRYEGCKFPEDLFINDIPLWQVTSLGELQPRKWYFDYANDTIYVADDPAGRKVEVSVTRHAFQGSVSHITIRGLIIEKYAVPAQHGAIHGKTGTNGPMSEGWIIEDNEVRFNHGAGIRTGNRMQVLRNYVHHNGQIGIVGAGDDLLIEDNEIAYNNYAGFSSGWEAGGTKFVGTRNLVVRKNSSHDNIGPGFWTDGDNSNSLYEANVVVNNSGKGIQHEISYDAIIRNNVVERNGLGFDVWLWGAQILIQNSQNVDVYNNKVVVSAAGGDGIGIINQNRGNGKFGPWISVNNHIHDNDITYLGNRGQSGAVDDTCRNKSDECIQIACNSASNNRFDYNSYHASHLDWSHWSWCAHKNWDAFKALGHEANGVADANIKVLSVSSEDMEVEPQ